MPPEKFETRSDRRARQGRRARGRGRCAGATEVPRHAVEDGVETQVLLGGQLLVEGLLLEYKPDAPPDGLGLATTSYPATLARPAVGRASVQRILMVVDLPAPFGPRKAKTSPRRHREADVADGLDILVALGEVDGLHRRVVFAGCRHGHLPRSCDPNVASNGLHLHRSPTSPRPVRAWRPTGSARVRVRPYAFAGCPQHADHDPARQTAGAGRYRARRRGNGGCCPTCCPRRNPASSANAKLH